MIFRVSCLLLCLVLLQARAELTSATTTEPVPPPSQAPKLSAAELEKLAMPVALHPDPLLSIILPASVYPLEIVQAARFVRDTNNVPKIDTQPWDDNVKAVAKFPELIAMMDSDLDWTMRLGQAFLDQPKELMDTIQALRAKAQGVGTLRSTAQQIVTVTNVVVLETNFTQVVTVTNQVVQVTPANPQVVYVPTYPPTVYYPPPAYVYDPLAPLVTFGVGMAVGAIIANNCDWHGGCVWVGHGDVDIDVNRNVNRDVNRNINRNQNLAANTAGTSQQKWQPNQNRLSSAGAPSATSREARGWGGSAIQSGSAGRPATSSALAGTGPSGTRSGATPSATPSIDRSVPRGEAARPSPSPGASRQPSTMSGRSPSSGGSAFSGMSSGADARSYSNRGAASRGSSFGGRTGGGGGRRR